MWQPRDVPISREGRGSFGSAARRVRSEFSTALLPGRPSIMTRRREQGRSWGVGLAQSLGVLVLLDEIARRGGVVCGRGAMGSAIVGTGHRGPSLHEGGGGEGVTSLDWLGWVRGGNVSTPSWVEASADEPSTRPRAKPARQRRKREALGERDVAEEDEGDMPSEVPRAEDATDPEPEADELGVRTGGSGDGEETTEEPEGDASGDGALAEAEKDDSGEKVCALRSPSRCLHGSISHGS
jgi:hypothetical protein